MTERIHEFLEDQSEKKVEYVELIYDLIFVYIIGRNSSLIHHVEDGFIPGGMFLTYCLCTLVALHIWYFTTLFINRYGTNDKAEYIALFVNMYLLYYVATGTRLDWMLYYDRYNIAWALIMLNIALQYYLKLRAQSGLMPWETVHLKHTLILILAEAGIILVSVPIYHMTGLPLSPLALLFGMLASIFSKGINSLVAVDFPHLTERIMLYVVFSFGEMIIAISEYFTDEFSVSSVYFSLMAFLIVAGLYSSYGYLYDHIIDREMSVSNNAYMILHIFLIFSLSNITVALEFMRMPEVDAVPKNIFIAVFFLLYFIFLFFIGRYSDIHGAAARRFFLKELGLSICFAVLTALFYRNPWVSIAIAVAYVYGCWFLIIKLNRRYKA